MKSLLPPTKLRLIYTWRSFILWCQSRANTPKMANIKIAIILTR